LEDAATNQAPWERGKSLRLAGRAEDAVRLLRGGSAMQMEDYRLHDELGTALSELGRHEEAIGSFLTALRLRPESDEVCNKIGCSFASRGMVAPAVEWFHRARQMNPHSTKYLGPYGRALVFSGCYQLAAEVIEQWTKAEPDNPVALHLAKAILGSQEATHVPTDYIRTLFNDCASRFDSTLANLKYCGPQLVVEALRQVAIVPAVNWDILDVGCGTGLVGAAIKPLARRLVGVDLSAGMLELARQRNVYDELIEGNMLDCLRCRPRSFDVLTASDVLSYMGDLGEFFQCATDSLRPGGFVVVAVEAFSGAGNYRLNPSGRFSHSLPYLRSVMEESGLTVAHIRDDVMRHETGRPVATLVAAGRSDAC
jgi:predicted TPR repeat methyltransferase